MVMRDDHHISWYAGNEESLLSGLLRTIELLHGIADEKERHQTVRVTSCASVLIIGP